MSAIEPPQPSGPPPAPPDAVAARYFDGKTSRLHRVTLTVRDGVARLAGDIDRAAPLADLRVSERSRHAARKVSFTDGAWLEVDDHAAFARLLASTGHHDGAVVRLQNSWRAVLGALAATVVVLGAGYLYLLPAAAGWIAQALPERVERQLGQGVLQLLDGRALAPTRLAPARQYELRRRFAAMTAPQAEAPSWRLVFRDSRIGPNAFALPSGDIVLTDQLVALLADDQAVMGVLAHELGHLHRRHLVRRMIQSSAVGAVTWLVFGDFSIMTTVPTLLLDMKYSRDAEFEADDYAVAMLRHNRISPEHLAAAFAKLDRLDPAADQAANPHASYLSSHPAGAERIARIRSAPSRAP